MADVFGTIEKITRGVQESLTVRTVYGDPITAGAVTVVPVARISFGFGGGGQGEDGQPSGQGQFRGQRFGDRDISGFGQRPDGGDGSDARQLPNGRQFPGRGDIRSRFSQRFGGQQFPGQGQLTPGLGGEVPGIEIPEGNGASF